MATVPSCVDTGSRIYVQGRHTAVGPAEAKVVLPIVAVVGAMATFVGTVRM